MEVLETLSMHTKITEQRLTMKGCLACGDGSLSTASARKLAAPSLM